MTTAYEDQKIFYGDIHNHCSIGYGHGSIEDAYQNGKLQLDFACVTPHAHWGDMPEDEKRLENVLAYHKRGFEIANKKWLYVQDVVESNYEPGSFVSFLGSEWHSMRHGDRNIVFNGSKGEIITADSLDDLHNELRNLAKQGIRSFAFAHHIGYKTGYRGINWNTFDANFSPLVEIMSMHGASESDDASYPYLHTMGPRDGSSTYHHGLSQGHIVGVFGSTDHHSAHPGSYGHGRMAVWSKALTRSGIWDAIQNRRTYALTGDRIALEFSLNDSQMGSVIPYVDKREINVKINGGDLIDYVEIIHNQKAVYCWKGGEPDNHVVPEGNMKVYLEVGWANKNEIVEWDVELELIGGELLSVEPRFRGPEVVAPTSNTIEKYVFSTLKKQENSSVSFSTQTWGNPTTTTASTQGVCLELDVNHESQLKGKINDTPIDLKIFEIAQISKVGYLGGFLSPAYKFHRAVPENLYTTSFSFNHHSEGLQMDYYMVRVKQKNGQWAWSSPIWVKPEKH